MSQTSYIRSIPQGKNFGFIKATDNSKDDLFFHKDDYLGEWNELVFAFNKNDRIQVEFDVVSNNKGPRAENVRRI